MRALSSLYERLWFALLEALAIGMPVVATRTGGAVEVITSGQNGLLVPRGDPVPLAAAIEQMLSDSSLRAEFREAGPPSVGSYDLEMVLDSTLNL